MDRVARAVFGLAFAALATGCVAREDAGETRTTVLSLEGLDSADPGVALAGRLRARRGVVGARFDLGRAELAVTARPSVDVVGEARALADPDYRVHPGAGRGSYVAWTRPPSGVDARAVVENGEDVPDLAALATPGKRTVVELGARWCAPCRDLDAHVLGLLVVRGDLAYRKLEIGDWDTPLARHYLPRGASLPYVIVLDGSGARLGTLSGLQLDRLDALLGPAPAR